MSVTQAVEIPDSHRLTIDVPREVPAGLVILTFTPATDLWSDISSHEKTVPPLESLRGADMGLIALRGIDKGRSTTDSYFARKRADKAKEDAQIARQLGLDKLPENFGAK